MGLSDLALDVGSAQKGANQRLANIIEFTESAWGLQMKLFPVQRVILKLHYGLPLDDNPYNFDLSQQVPLDHPEYDEITLKEGQWKGLYKYVVPISDWRRSYWRYLSEAEYVRYLHSEGRCNVNSSERELRIMLLSIGRRSGKCVTGDTLVLTDRGVLPIQELGDPHGPEFQPLEVQVAQEGQETRGRSAYFYNGGVKDTIKFRTRSGFELEGTPNHRVKVMSPKGLIEWKHLGDLQNQDVVCIHKTSNQWSQSMVDLTSFHPKTTGSKKITLPKYLTEDWALLLGYLVGDGTWSTKGGVELTVGDPEAWVHSKALFERVLGGWKQYRDFRTVGTGTLRFFSTELRKFLHNVGYEYGLGRDQKRVPWVVMRSPQIIVRSFLRGLFETDGGVEKGGKTVSFSTSSKQLGKEVQILLLNLGIVSTRKEKIIQGKSYWILAIRGLSSRRKFAEHVGFVSSRKQDPLVQSFSSSKEGGDAESIPHQKEHVKKFLEAVPKNNPGQGWNRSDFRRLLGNTIKSGSQEQLTYSRLQNSLELANQRGVESSVIPHFKMLVGTNYFFDPIVMVETGKAHVFDLNVPENHEFVANGMTNHNTQLASIISAYETYKLILKGDPQAYYGLPAGEPIQLISVATDEGQAGILYSKVSGYYKDCAFFKRYMANNTMSYARFQTPRDIERYGKYEDDEKANATIRVTFRPCRAKGLRGAGNIVAILDEMAHFKADEGQSSAEEVWTAIRPSLSAFSQKDPKDNTFPIGPVEGRLIGISSPLGRTGGFFKHFQDAMSGIPNMLAIEAPTWEVNPSIEAGEMEEAYRADANIFFTEYGGRFSHKTKGWLESDEDLMKCVDPKLKPKLRGKLKTPHFVGLDFALVNDGSAIAIGHINDLGEVELDCIEEIRAGEGKFENVTRLELDDVVDWVVSFSRKFMFEEGLFDQWAGPLFQAALHKQGLGMLVSDHFTKQKSSDVYKNLKDMMWNGKLRLYDWPTKQGEHCAYITELCELQASYHSKYIVTVEAPDTKGKHDDMSDALARMVWIASQRLAKPLHIAGRTAQDSKGKSSATTTQDLRKAAMKAKRRGSSPDRQPLRGRGGRR